MALYLFEHPTSGEIREIYFKLDDKKEYFGEAEDGEQPMKWNRRFTIPYASSNSKVSDPFSKGDFLTATGDKKNITFGDLWDKSAELSEKRTKIAGEDPMKQQYYDNYAQSRKGLKHLTDGRDKKVVQEKFGANAKPNFANKKKVKKDN
jgi:hypothetical protein